MATATVKSKELTPETAKAIHDLGLVLIRGGGNRFTIVGEAKTISPQAMAGIVRELKNLGYEPSEHAVTFGEPIGLREDTGCGRGDCACGGEGCGCDR